MKVRLYKKSYWRISPISIQNNTQSSIAQQTPSPFTQSNKLPTSNNVSASSISAKDIADMRNDYDEQIIIVVI